LKPKVTTDPTLHQSKMHKLYFRYGTMNSSKTTLLLTTAHNYTSLERRAVIIKPSVDTRSGPTSVASRCGLSRPADVVVGPDDTLAIPDVESVACILIDEAQFLSPEQVDQLRQLTRYAPVIAYGLRTDSQVRLFPGSRRLFEVADSIEEVKMICSECTKKSTVNARYCLGEDGTKQIVYDAEQIAIGGEDMYYALCFSCWDKAR
jgi:thymidine kinase